MEGTKSFSHEQNGSTLTSDLLVRMVVSLTYVLLDIMASTHICHGRNLILYHDQNGSALTSDLLVRMDLSVPD